LLRDGLLDGSKALFDYGCGHGQDVELLHDLNIPCAGWDPVHRQHVERTSADIVSLGYVINVIEDPRERVDALRQAWRLCHHLLVVAAQLDLVAPDKNLPGFSDGILTSRGTFQKYYTQAKLRMYLEESLGADTIPAAPGVFYVFKDETAKQQFLANRYRRRVAAPPRRVSELQFEQNKDVLEPFMESLIQLGRIPGPEELSESTELINRFGSLKRAWALVQRATDSEPWKGIAKRRTVELRICSSILPWLASIAVRLSPSYLCRSSEMSRRFSATISAPAPRRTRFSSK
jgi:DNA phosphorothioation-associated putative methyltransferase